LWRPRFPGPELVGAAADLLPTVQPVSGRHAEIGEENLRLGVVALVFRCTPLGTVHRDSAETVAVRWVDPDEITALMDPAYAVRVTDAFEKTAVTRAHDGVQLLSA